MKISNSALILTLIYFTLLQTAFAELKTDVLKPYNGPSVLGVDPSTLAGKVMTGYQGWFNCEGDGANLGWTHWARDRSKAFGPGNVTVDLYFQPFFTERSSSSQPADKTYADAAE